MNRRQFLSVSAASLTTVPSLSPSVAESAGGQYPDIHRSILEQYGWGKTGHPDRPELQDEVDDDLTFYITRFTDTRLHSSIETDISRKLASPVMTLIAMRVTGEDYLIADKLGEKGEVLVGTDGEAEAIFEELAEEGTGGSVDLRRSVNSKQFTRCRTVGRTAV